jgi:hypothetical protein
VHRQGYEPPLQKCAILLIKKPIFRTQTDMFWLFFIQFCCAGSHSEHHWRWCSLLFWIHFFADGNICTSTCILQTFVDCSRFEFTHDKGVGHGLYHVWALYSAQALHLTRALLWVSCNVRGTKRELTKLIIPLVTQVCRVLWGQVT